VQIFRKVPLCPRCRNKIKPEDEFCEKCSKKLKGNGNGHDLYEHRKTYVDDKLYLRFRDSDKLVHLWVAKAKYPNANFEGMEVHHLDGNPQNNKKDNLILLRKDDHFLLHDFIEKIDARGLRIAHSDSYALLWLAFGFAIFGMVPIIGPFFVFLALIILLVGIVGIRKKK